MTNALIGLVLLFVFLIFWGQQAQRRILEARLTALQRQLDALAKHLNLKVDDLIPPGVAGLLQEGRKIEAIKVYREATGAGLAEAKVAVERIQARLSGTIIQP